MITTFSQKLLAAFAALAVLTPVAADAQIRRVSGSDTRQSFGVNLGAFFPRSEDSRVDGDVLVENRSTFLFDIAEFRGFTFGAEYLVGLTEHLEAGVDVGYYQKSVPSIYADVVHEDGREIEQDFKLRIIPVTGSIRFVPTGRYSAVQPYIGIGAGVLNWRYSETGEFVDFAPFPPEIFRNRYIASGTEVAPVVIGGLRFLGADVWTAGGEVRWQRADADTGGEEAGFFGDRIDLGGWTTTFTIHFRF